MGKVWRPPPAPPKLVIQPPKVDVKSGGADADVQCIGSGSLKAALLALPSVSLDAAGNEMSRIMHEVIVDSQENYVPVLSRALKNSGDSDPWEPGSTRNVNAAEIRGWFGAPGDGEAAAGGDWMGNASDIHGAPIHVSGKIAGAIAAQVGLNEPVSPDVYALAQHEDPTFKHTQDHGAGPNVGFKYLERPFMLRESGILWRISKAIADALGASNNITPSGMDLGGLEKNLQNIGGQYGAR